MEFEVIEQTYPENFRSDLTLELTEHIDKRRSVVFAGMRRVGISNFLRFFLYHKKLRSKLSGDLRHLYVAVDLNDLIERTLPLFWVLTLKRILDAVESSDLNPKVRKYVENLFLDGIQSKNTFLLVENIKKALNKIISEGIYPTIFFIRFDRISESSSAEFFANLEGLKDATHNKLSFVFTTSRGLNSVSPKVFSHTSLSLAESQIFLKPASEPDLKIICDAYIKRFGLRISTDTERELIRLTGGYVQYLQLALISLGEPESSNKNLFELLASDERINLQSEELWEGLTEAEQHTMLKILNQQSLSKNELADNKYLLDSGFIVPEKNESTHDLTVGVSSLDRTASDSGEPRTLQSGFYRDKYKIFSPIFENFLKTKNGKGEGRGGKIELSKKEHLLFSYLKQNLDQICEREAIIEAVWPEEEALGVSDWAIDRLVARLRKKIKEEGKFEIVTIKTRGFKLTSINQSIR